MNRFLRTFLWCATMGFVIGVAGKLLGANALAVLVVAMIFAARFGGLFSDPS